MRSVHPSAFYIHRLLYCGLALQVFSGFIEDENSFFFWLLLGLQETGID